MVSTPASIFCFASVVSQLSASGVRIVFISFAAPFSSLFEHHIGLLGTCNFKHR